jgi:hypothetical protein
MQRRWSRNPTGPILTPFLLAVLLLGGLQPTVLAQAGEAIDPAECQVEPISVETLLPLWFPEQAATPRPATPTAQPELASVPLPLGEPADPATVAAITGTVRELFACQNRIENGRLYALLSEELLRQIGPPPGEGPEDLPAHLAPFEPISVEEYVRLIAVTDVAVMVDGRVAALVIADDPPIPPEGPETQLVLFVEDGDRWVIDAVAGFTAVAAPPAVAEVGEASPAAPSTPGP